MTRSRIVRRILTPPAFLLAALIFLFEDILWSLLADATAKLAKLPPFVQIERGVRNLGAYPTLLLFLVPMLCLFPVKLAAVALMAKGQPLLGVGVLLLAKIGGTAIGARIYALSKHKLLTIAWFRTGHDWIFATKTKLYAYARSFAGYRLFERKLKVLKKSLSNLLPVGKSLLRRRIGAARRSLRKSF